MAYYGQQGGYQQGGYQQGGYQQGGYQQGYGYQTGSHPPPPQGQQAQNYYQQQYQSYQQPSQHYGGYGGYYQDNVFAVNANEAYRPADPNWSLQVEFDRACNATPANAQRRAIQAEDLCNVMNNCQTIKNHFRINWSRELCSIMLTMLDRSGDGFMQINEFMELQQCLVQWFQTFCQYDSNRSGFIEASELSAIITNLYKYTLSPKAMETLLKRYSRVIDHRCLIAFDDFVACSVRLRAYTDAFRKRDQAEHHGQEAGSTTFGYDDHADDTSLTVSNKESIDNVFKMFKLYEQSSCAKINKETETGLP